MTTGTGRITLQEAATRLGVHYMTAYRYVRTGRLPGERSGANWLVDPAALDRLGPAAPSAPRPPRGTARAEAPGRLAARLVAGDEAGAWHLVETALTSGLDPDGGAARRGGGRRARAPPPGQTPPAGGVAPRGGLPPLAGAARGGGGGRGA